MPLDNVPAPNKINVPLSAWINDNRQMYVQNVIHVRMIESSCLHCLATKRAILVSNFHIGRTEF